MFLTLGKKKERVKKRKYYFRLNVLKNLWSIHWYVLIDEYQFLICVRNFEIYQLQVIYSCSMLFNLFIKLINETAINSTQWIFSKSIHSVASVCTQEIWVYSFTSYSAENCEILFSATFVDLFGFFRWIKYMRNYRIIIIFFVRHSCK